MNKGVVAIVAVLLCSYYVAALDNASELGISAFAGNSSIAPPQIPQDGQTLEQIPGAGLTLELRDYYSKQQIKNIHVQVEILDNRTGSTMKTLQYIGSSGLLVLDLDGGDYLITLKIDRIETDGNDYYYSADIIVKKNEFLTIYVFPIGSVRGIVYDRNGGVATNAALKFDCSNRYGETKELATDDFGSFMAGWLPVGSCKISASQNGYIGYLNFEVNASQIKDVEIRLDKKSGGSGRLVYVLFGVLVIVIAIVLFALPKRKKEAVAAPTQEINSRTEDVMKTLNEKESLVVNALMKSENESTQARLKHNTGIPKTSLIRVFDSLEKKKIITVQRLGKLKKIRLTPWFMGK